MTIPQEAELTGENNTQFSHDVLQYHWNRFAIFANNQGISLQHPDDYLTSWENYLYGAFQECERK